MKAIADDKINVTEKSKFILGRAENIVGKGENTGYHHFLLFPKGFFFNVDVPSVLLSGERVGLMTWWL